MKLAGRMVSVVIVLALLYCGLILVTPVHPIADIGTALVALGWLFTELEKWSAERANRQWEELRQGAWSVVETNPGLRQEHEWKWAEASTSMVAREATNSSSISVS